MQKRVLKIPLPRITGSLICPAQALLLSFKMAPANSSCSPAFLYKNGTKVIPLTYSVFLSKLKRFLSVLGINNTLYSGHSFRWGGRGASFALECGVPSELIRSHGDWKSDTSTQAVSYESFSTSFMQGLIFLWYILAALIL